MKSICKIEGCGNKVNRRGLCNKHLRKWIEGKADYEPDKPKRRLKYVGQLCAVGGCKTPAIYLDMCPIHGQRVERRGGPEVLIQGTEWRMRCREAKIKRNPTRKKTTYKKYMGRHEHRVIAEETIGRPLVSGEIVHHIDGDRHNNSPDNLAVMTQSDHINLHFRRNTK